MKDPWSDEVTKSNNNQSEVVTIINSILQTVSFFIFDSNKMEEIIKGVERKLRLEHNLKIHINIKWLPPEIKTEIEKEEEDWDLNI